MTDDIDMWFREEADIAQGLGPDWRTKYKWVFSDAETGYWRVRTKYAAPRHRTIADCPVHAVPVQTFIDLVEARFGIEVER